MGREFSGAAKAPSGPARREPSVKNYKKGGKEMALRLIRELGDPVLGKKAKTVKEMTPKLKALIEDMKETMYDSDGVGLAAPQVGMLKRIVVIDVSAEQNQPIVMINPEILEQDGEQTGWEGCLSVPGKSGQVTRPRHVKAKALDENMQEFIIEGEDLLARAICHELDHLDGHMYVELVEGRLYTNEELDEMMEKEEEAKATEGEA
jgi:peptide deformylase